MKINRKWLCADIGSDSYPYQCDDEYEVIKVGQDVGVENFTAIGYGPVHGIIANPPCTEFSTARSDGRAREGEEGMWLVNECLRVIREAQPKWWVIENPARGTLKNYLGEPRYKYEPWHYGSPWTKQTALWGNFNIPQKQYVSWEQVEKNEKLYIRPGRPKPGFAFLHKSAIHDIPEFKPFIPFVDSDMSFRSLCSQGFAKEFKKVNN